MERLWRHTFYEELRVYPDEVQGVVVTEPLATQERFDRERMLISMFETFEVKNLYVAN